MGIDNMSVAATSQIKSKAKYFTVPMVQIDKYVKENAL